jgi:hypothetical protein
MLEFGLWNGTSEVEVLPAKETQLRVPCAARAQRRDDRSALRDNLDATARVEPADTALADVKLFGYLLDRHGVYPGGRVRGNQTGK